MIDIDAAPVDDKLKPLLRYVRKLTLTPARMTPGDADAVFGSRRCSMPSACALYSFMNRIVEGTGTKHDLLPESPAEREARRQHHASEAGNEPTRCERQQRLQ